MSLPKHIVANIKTNSKYGLVEPGTTLEVGIDIDEQGARRWLDNGIARSGELVKKKSELKSTGKPTSSNTKKEIKQWLDDQGIEYASDALKDDLLELVE